MKKGIEFAGFLFLAIATALPVAFAQISIVPFHAKLQRVQQIFDRDGSLQSEQTIIDDYTRDSKGNTYTDSRIMNSLTGQMQDTVKMIENSDDGKMYLIDEGEKTVVIASHPVGFKPYMPPQGGNRPTKTYLGRTCIVLKNAEGEGEIYMDAELGYPLYERREVSQAEGKKLIRIVRVTDLALIHEPDSSLFELPSLSGYNVIDRTAIK